MKLVVFNHQRVFTHCDYWQSEECARGEPRFVLFNQNWYLLMPNPRDRQRNGEAYAHAQPVTYHADPSGWAWDLKGAVTMKVPTSLFWGEPEHLPAKGTYRKCWLVIMEPVHGSRNCEVQTLLWHRLTVYREWFPATRAVLAQKQQEREMKSDTSC